MGYLYSGVKEKVIYIAGPFRGETPMAVERNVRAAEEASLLLWQAGVFNICPHTMGRFFDKMVPDPVVLAGTMEIMLRCDAVWCFSPMWKVSGGTVAEVEKAREMGMPVFFLLHEVLDHVRKTTVPDSSG